MALEFSDHPLFSTATLLILAGNVSSEIRTNFVFSETSIQIHILDTFVSGSLTNNLFAFGPIA